MKRNYIFLFIIFMFIASCGNKITAPSETSGIIYYDPETAETKDLPFFKFDNATGKDIAFKSKFKKLAESKNTIIYLENGYTLTRYQLNNFITQFEEAFEKEKYIYGNPSDLDQNGKIIFLIASLNTNGQRGFGGYFNDEDLIYGKDNVKGEYLHIDPSVADENYILGIMMHELQHLINYYNNAMQGKAMDIWLNEGLSESTSHIFAKDISDSRIQAFNAIPYYSFYSWYFQYSKDNYIFGTPMDSFSYAPVSMFMKWIDTKTGNNQEIYKRIASYTSISDSEQRLMQSIQELNPNLGTDMDTLLIDYIADIYKGNDLGLGVEASRMTDLTPERQAYFEENGQTLLIPRALIICPTDDANKITDSKVTKKDLGDGYSVILNNSKNTSPGKVSANNIARISITKTTASKALSSKYNDFDLSIFNREKRFIDMIISENEAKEILNNSDNFDY